ncbi:hypothetical protein OsI_35342 [Oryza sativa Indica Group]|uniref:Uncharacterized protein n=1 Tax=Oryza sativa subsp. indica TaxID=39946 RepID=A2ZC37_ORYSI|nr:hypothetical protein OsI_35342 [Oryza sativa Indica Group]
MSSSEPKPLHCLLRRGSKLPEPEPLLNLPLLRESISIPADEPDTTKHKRASGHCPRSSRSPNNIGNGRRHGHNDGSVEERWWRGPSGDDAGRGSMSGRQKMRTTAPPSCGSREALLPLRRLPCRLRIDLGGAASLSSSTPSSTFYLPHCCCHAVAASSSSRCGGGDLPEPTRRIWLKRRSRRWRPQALVVVAEKLEERSGNFGSIIPASQGSSPLLFLTKLAEK